MKKLVTFLLLSVAVCGGIAQKHLETHVGKIMPGSASPLFKTETFAPQNRAVHTRGAQHSLTVKLVYDPSKYDSWSMFRVAGKDFYQGYFTGDDPGLPDEATLTLPEGRYVVFCEFPILNENIVLGIEGFAWIVKEIELKADMEIELKAEDARNVLTCNSVTPDGSKPELPGIRVPEDGPDDYFDKIEGNISKMVISNLISSGFAGFVYERQGMGDFQVVDERGGTCFDLARHLDIRINDVSEDICLHQYNVMTADDGFYVTSMRPVSGLQCSADGEYEQTYSPAFTEEFAPSLKARDNNPEVYAPAWSLHTTETFVNGVSFPGYELAAPSGNIQVAGITNGQALYKIRVHMSYADWGVEEKDPDTEEVWIHSYPSPAQPFAFDESGNPVKEYVQLIDDFKLYESLDSKYAPWNGHPAFSHAAGDTDLLPMGTQPSLIADSREAFNWDDEKEYWYLDCLPVGRLGEWQLGNLTSVQTAEKEIEGGVTEFTASLSGLDVDGIEGRTRMTLYFNPEEDINPPALQIVQFRDTEGKVTDRFKNASDGVLRFAAADFNQKKSAEIEHHWWFETDPVDVIVEYSPVCRESWTPLDVEERPEWFTKEFGYVYEGSLKEVSSPDYSGWYDLRITMTDSDGSVSRQGYCFIECV